MLRSPYGAISRLRSCSDADLLDSRSLGRRVPVVVALPWGQPAARIASHDTCASLAGRPLGFFGCRRGKRHANDAQSTRGSSLAHHWQAVAFACGLRRRPANDAQVRFARHLRIIGRPSRPYVGMHGGLPMMRKACVGRHLRIIGRPSWPYARIGGSLPMMRKANTAIALRIIGRPFVHSALLEDGFKLILAIM